MMATTHALLGVALAAVVATVAPEHAPVAAAGALAGGVFPDLDLYGDHRKHLHFPVYYSLLAGGAVAVALTVTQPATVALAAFLVAAALHSAMDALGGGLELEPWRGESQRAVYSHFHGRWIAPRRWIRYDGAPEDLALAGVLTVPSVLVFDGYVQWVVLGALGVSAVYTLLRKRLVPLWLAMVDLLPLPVQRRLPERFHQP